MCWGDPAKSLALARERLTPEQWARFEREFDDFCVVQGLVKPKLTAGVNASIDDAICYLETRKTFSWAKWAFFCAKPRPAPLELTDWMPCTTPPVRDGWYDVWRGAQLASKGLVLATIPERVRFRDGKWDRESCESKVGVWPSWDCWRGVKGDRA